MLRIVVYFQLNIESSKELRLLEVAGNKINAILPREKALEELTSFGQAARTYRKCRSVKANWS